ncbi:MAG: metallophosphoesterase [Desulfovibrionaceae bacterium]|nr:metallophosphoesterase [Desulfovibrionaceae bacterium]MBF0513094.1 metallophosphoesterase [Desulfovibrionaceae bacterium]
MAMQRREFLKLAGIGSVFLVTGLGRTALAAGEKSMVENFTFVQMSDSHWGFSGAPVNPEAAVTLKKAVAEVNALAKRPDFIVFTGDLTHTTDDPQERRKRLREFKEIMSGLLVKDVKYIPGEHDASLDNGEAFKEFFGPTHYAFNHKGVHFIALDNVSDPTASLGEEQLQWFGAELAKLDKNAPLVVVTHRPLFDLYPQWDWATRDGAKAVAMLEPFADATVLYGHIHQENHFMTGAVPHHAAKSLVFPLPAPGSTPKRVPVLWDPAAPFQGLGVRGVAAMAGKKSVELTEYPLKG